MKSTLRIIRYLMVMTKFLNRQGAWRRGKNMKRLVGCMWLMMLMLSLSMGCVTGKGQEVKTAKAEQIEAKYKTEVKSSSKLHQHLSNSTVALVARNDEGNIRPYCTGVWVSETEIVTAAHCVEEDEFGILSPVGKFVHYIVQPEVRGMGQEPAALHLAEVKYVVHYHDVAVLKAFKAGIPMHEYVVMAEELPGVGEAVYIVGHPRGHYWSFAQGIVSAYRTETSIGPAVQVNGTVWFGNSGGGVFDSQGRLVGICSRLTGIPEMSLFAHLDSVKRAVDKSR